MDFSLGEELVLLRDSVRKFAEKEIAPFADKWDEQHHWPRDVVSKMADMGLFGAVIPEQYGGTGMGWLALVIATEEIARASSSLRVAFNMQTAGPAYGILMSGTEEQKSRYIPGLCSAELIGCFAITEPDAGSDVLSMKTTAKLDGDHYILNGSKIWISNAQYADVALVYAYTDKS